MAKAERDTKFLIPNTAPGLWIGPKTVSARGRRGEVSIPYWVWLPETHPLALTLAPTRKKGAEPDSCITRDPSTATTTKWPVILYLHDSGVKGTDGLRHLSGRPYVGIVRALEEHSERFPFIIVFPQCPPKTTWTRDIDGFPVADLAMQAARLSYSAYGGDPERLYLTGWSLGGFGSWHVAAKYPSEIAAAVPICGGGPRSLASTLSTVPIWCFHGSKDMDIPAESSRKLMLALRQPVNSAGKNLRSHTRASMIRHASVLPHTGLTSEGTSGLTRGPRCSSLFSGMPAVVEDGVITVNVRGAVEALYTEYPAADHEEAALKAYSDPMMPVWLLVQWHCSPKDGRLKHQDPCFGSAAKHPAII